MSNFLQNVNVDAIYENDVTFNDKTTNEPVTKQSYNVVLSGQKVSFGFKKPAFNKGDTVSVYIKMNGKYANAILDTLEVVSKVPQPASSTPNNSVPTAPTSKKSTDWDAKDKKAALGFAREQAIKVLTVNCETIQLEELDELTMRFIEQANKFLETGTILPEGTYTEEDEVPFDDSGDF